METDNRSYIVLSVMVMTALTCLFSIGISGNDFWWHVKAGEWMVTNFSLPSVDVFSWYAKENQIEWLSHEWLSQVIFYLIHHTTGEIGIYLFSLTSACLMAFLIIRRNKKFLGLSILLPAAFFLPMSVLFKLMFYGRPHLFSYFLIYATLACLYHYRSNESSKAIYLIPLIAFFWANLHGGSSTMSYILCFAFFVTSSFEFSIGKLHFDKLPRNRSFAFLIAGLASILALIINPYSIEMLVYPYSNMGDSFMQKMISEWSSPDAKEYWQVFILFFPLSFVSLGFMITEKKIKAVDLLIFLFFSYMFFRSVRFGVVFYIASTFFVFEYFPVPIFAPAKKHANTLFYVVLAGLLILNIMGISNTIKTTRENRLISTVLESRFIELVKKESPKRLYNDYDFGVSLIYNNIETFVDARADLFSPHNLRDAFNLANLTNKNSSIKNEQFTPEILINKYRFDAFLTRSGNSLAAYLRERKDKYEILLEDSDTVYFKRIFHP
ncbi:MAG: hypothetical protein CVV42_09410 [Candidatus Riflebacteria bacterium HGW-Riflebacteria-2]|jgi:hypothetical protein|nr:MAG: hypothetical protein CVV42_09410 [Candidatus Riflebacteria bacterium HGW-Riflebacteria-2]